jgi:Transglutaminase-like superfamily/Coenzyme PQQ synthesis protein D (PqqD)
MIWLRLDFREFTEDDIVQELRARYPIELERLSSDVAAFLKRALQEGLLQPFAAASAPPIVRRVSDERLWCPELQAWRMLWATATRLRRDGFTATYEMSAGLATIEPLPFTESRFTRAVMAFARAENFFVHRDAPTDCLPRSLALFGFLRRMRLQAEHVIGVQRSPFQAHAWVELSGKVVLDADRRTTFTPIARLS